MKTRAVICPDNPEHRITGLLVMPGETATVLLRPERARLFKCRELVNQCDAGFVIEYVFVGEARQDTPPDLVLRSGPFELDALHAGLSISFRIRNPNRSSARLWFELHGDSLL